MITNRSIGTWWSLSCVPWYPGYTWCFIYLQKGAQSLETRVHMTNLKRSKVSLKNKICEHLKYPWMSHQVNFEFNPISWHFYLMNCFVLFALSITNVLHCKQIWRKFWVFLVQIQYIFIQVILIAIQNLDKQALDTKNSRHDLPKT